MSVSVTAQRRVDKLVPSEPALIVLSANERPGRRFQPVAERQLDEDLVTLATKLPGTKLNRFIIAEAPGPRGVADLVVAIGSGSALSQRRDSGIPPLLNLSACSVAAALPLRRDVPAETVAANLGISIERARTQLRALGKTGHVIKNGAKFRRAPEVQAMGRTYALEAKVADWRRGLNQAIRYSSWCDAAAVVVLEEPRDLPSLITRFQRFDVGLAVRSRWVIRPRLGSPNPGWRLWSSEQLLAASGAVSIQTDQ